MPNSGVNTAFAKCFIFFMAVVILLQGGVYLSLSVWGITLRQCSNDVFDLSSQPFQFVMNLIYFLNKDCGNPSVKVPDLTESVTLYVDFNKAEPIEHRLFILLISYAVISTLWIVTSLAIITTLCGPITRKVNGLCFWPWFLVIMSGCILDAATTGFHIHDIINTTSVVKTFEYLSITANEKTIEVLSNFDAYFVTPAVIMTCISSRVVLIWLLNIFGSIFCLSLSKTLSKNDNGATTAYVNNIQPEPCPEILPAQRRKEQRSNVIERSKLASLNIQSVQRPTIQSDQSLRTYDIESPTAPAENLYHPAPSPSEQQVNKINCNTETHLDGINYASQYQQQLSPISPLNNRYSTNNENFQFPIQNQRVSEELRGQLPWSYTSMPPPGPKKVYPEIPEPDYGH